MEQNINEQELKQPVPQERSPEEQVGAMLLKEVSEKSGISKEEAFALIMGQEPAEIGVRAASKNAAEQLIALQGEGKLAFAPEEYISDEWFIDLLGEMPVGAAVKVFETVKASETAVREAQERGAQDILEKLAARKALPLPIRPGINAAPETNYFNMSAEDFKTLRQQIISSLQKGGKPTLG